MADIEQVCLTTKDIIRKASADNTLHEITPRQIRAQIEKQLGLEDGALDAKEYRNAVKAATAEAIEELETTDEAAQAAEPQTASEAMEDDEEKPAKATKRKSEAKPSAARKKPRAESTDKEPVSSGKKSREGSRKPKGQKVVRSASVVPSSDEEEGEAKAASSSSASKPKPKSAKPVNASPPAGSDHEHDDASRPDTGVDQSESEDDAKAPKRKNGKAKDKASTKKAPTTRKRKSKDASDESPEDAEIKRLKSFITACGVRKIWSREFKDIPDDKGAQIRRLKSLLAELGMSGRLSMEKAKAIRAKRELAQELEDVRNFEKAVVNGPGASRGGKGAREKEETDKSEEEAEEEEEAIPRKKRAGNARMSIMAFLGDQSDDE